MKFLKITNVGEVDPAGLRLMGASSKRGQDKIGFFGTGTKYAMATLMRLGATVRVFTGLREVPLGTKPVTMRGQVFQEITVDGLPTGITTDVGPKWEPWMAVREFVCNAIDEGSFLHSVAVEAVGSVGATNVFISLEHVADVLENWQAYFRFGEVPVESTIRGKVLKKHDEKTRFYRKGVLVHVSHEASAYDWQDDNIPISEERLALGYNCANSAWGILNLAGDSVKKKVVERFLPFDAGMAGYLGDPSWKRIFSLVCTKEEKATYRDDHAFAEAVVVPDQWLAPMRDSGVKTARAVLQTRSRAVDEMTYLHPMRTRGYPKLDRCLAVLAKHGVMLKLSDIVLVHAFEDPHVAGTWDGRVIRVLEGLTEREMTRTIFHEWAHKTSGCDDRTVGFESFLDGCVAKLIYGGWL